MFGKIVPQIMRGERDNPKHFAQIPNPLIDSLPGDTFILIALKEGAVAALDLLGQQWDIELGSSFGRWEQGQDIYLVGLLSSHGEEARSCINACRVEGHHFSHPQSMFSQQADQERMAFAERLIMFAI